MYSTLSAQPPVASSTLPELMLVDNDETTSKYILPLREKFRVWRFDAVATALRHVTGAQSSPGLVVTELALPDGPGVDVCRAVKGLRVPATVLVTTSDVAGVPDALEAGCDAVLLKPFAPNLLFSRVGRLARARSAELLSRSARQKQKSSHLQERSGLLLGGTNRQWPNTHCPYCAHSGVTSFEYAAYRRAWYACLSCKKVWIAKRPE